MNDKPRTWNIPVRTAEGKELQRKYAEAWPGLEGAKAMIQLNLDDIEAVLDRANDDADRVSVYEYREALNAVYHTALRILSQKMAVEREVYELRLACDGCADSEHKTGRAHYDDCPVGVAVRERDKARAEVERVRAEWQRDLDGCNTIIDRLKARLGDK